MIISRLHNFVFIKTHKTAGSSMETALASHAGPDDLVTPFGVEEEMARYRAFPNAFPRNYCADKSLEAAYRDAIANGDEDGSHKAFRALKDTSKRPGFGRHGGAKLAQRFAGEALWNSAYKFTIERHPYEKAVSLAWFERRQRDFAISLDSVLEHKRYRNFDLYAMDEKPVVDFIIRFEKLAEDTVIVEKAIGLDIVSRLPRQKSQHRLDPRPAREVLTEAQKKSVQATCREEFELFGYEP